nr:hypothetical protein [uncultured bacterium]
MPSTTVYILFAVICVIVGFIIGALVTLFFSERDKKQMSKEGGSLPEDIDPDQHTPLLRLWRTADDALLVEMKGRVLSDIKQASTAQRLELEAVTEKWFKWLGLRLDMPKPEATPKPQPAPAAEPAPLRPPVPSRPVAAIPDVNVILTPPTPVSTDSMVAQIDEIFQDLIRNSDQQQHSVKITQDFREGIIILLDGERYVGVDEVPDPEIKKLIRAAVAEWERRSERV